MRWNMADAALILTFLNLAFLIKKFECSILILMILALFSFFALLIVHYKTGEDYNARVDKVQNLLDKEDN
jgi:hypothetical protein